MSNRTILYGLAAIPFFDCIFAQLNNGLHITIGPLSLLQLVHGPLILVFVAVCVHAARQNSTSLTRIPLPALASFLLLAIVSTKELVVKGTLSLASVSPYGQMAYWMFFWIAVSMFCRRHEDTEIILRGFAVGAVATAVSVFLGLVFGAPNYYSEDAVSSSAGWFDTAKMVTGVLNTGAVLLLYLGRKRGGWLSPFLACTCFAACIVTYARAGWVALAAILVWLPLWTIVLGRGQKRRWTARFLVLIFATAVLLPVVTDTGKLFARFGNSSAGSSEGSGRSTFWKIAIDGYVAATPAQQSLGRGYGAMSDLLLREYGLDIKHTHNDLLDMLTVGGLMGALWLFFFIATLFWRLMRSSLLSIEGAAGLAILLNYLLHSQLTGQIWGTDAMSYYVIGLTCLYRNARLDRATSPHLHAASTLYSSSQTVTA